jgi:hypothetical protein
MGLDREQGNYASSEGIRPGARELGHEAGDRISPAWEQVTNRDWSRSTSGLGNDQRN